MTDHRAFAMASALVTAAWALPAAAQPKQAADHGAQVCELEWNASFGRVALTQWVSGSGAVTSEYFSIMRSVPVSSGFGAILAMHQTGAQPEFTLRLGGPTRKDKNQRLVFTVPGSEPLVVAAEQGVSSVRLDQAQLAYLLAATGPVTYRLVKQDGIGRETQQLSEGQIDLHQFAGQDLAGLPEAARLSRAVLTQARGGDNPPCAMAWAANMNAAYNSEPARKWLSFDCGEEWSGPLGAFRLQAASFSWRRRPRDGVFVNFEGSMQVVPRIETQRFIDNPGRMHGFGAVSIGFDSKAWGLNFRGKDQAAWQRQSGELSRGGERIAKALSQEGSTGFFWSEFSQLAAKEGDLTISARDSISGLRFDTVLPWSEVTAAEAELRVGQARLRERERDPLARCRAQVQEESGMEEEIVT